MKALALNLTLHGLTYNNREPFQFMIGFLLHGDLVRIGSKEIFTLSLTDLYKGKGVRCLLQQTFMDEEGCVMSSRRLPWLGVNTWNTRF